MPVNRLLSPFCCAVLAAATGCVSLAAAPATATVTLRRLVRHVRATGSVQPVEAVTIQVPEIVDSRGNMILTKIVPTGKVVQAGDVVAEFDRTRLLDQARDAKAKFEDLRHQAEQRVAQHHSDDARRASELQQASADLAKAQLELRKGPLLSEIDRLKAETKLEIATAHVASLKKTIRARQRSEAADLRIIELQRDRQKLAMERAQSNAARLEIRAPIAGMVSHEVVWRRDGVGDPQEGDQLWSGQSLLRIFSSADMEIQLTVAEPDGTALQPGARALVHLDAYPNLEFHASLVSAAPVASSLLDSTIRNFPARFRLEERDPHLLPDLAASADLEIATDRPVPCLARTAVHYRRGTPYVLRLDPHGAARETTVSLGAFDDAYIEVKSGLAAGDPVEVR
jgi:multidrug efflux pump subunit AcrA (membrane-fusion protein)